MGLYLLLKGRLPSGIVSSESFRITRTLCYDHVDVALGILRLPDLADTEAQSKVRESVKEKKVKKRYQEEFKREAVELVIHSGNSQGQIARAISTSCSRALKFG